MTRTPRRWAAVAAVSLASFALVAANSTASVAAAPDVFSITTLTTSTPVFVDTNALAGDDDGFLGVTGTKFVMSGDSATVAYDLADMGNPYVTNVDNSNDENNWLFSDVKTQTSYLFEHTDLGSEAYDITGFQPLDQTGDIAGSPVALSTAVSIDNGTDDCTIFASGYGRVAIWDGCLGVVYDIALPSGEVTTVTGVATFADYDATTPVLSNYYEVDNSVSQAGIVEFDGSALHVVIVAADSGGDPAGIYRYDVQNAAAAPTELLSFGGVFVDMYELTVSPATNQWCSHVENGWDAISTAGESELAFCAAATFSAVVAAPAAAPGLAATGVNAAPYIAVGGTVLLLGFGLIVVGRRRRAA
jgi:LPXTG-motif cell wall-anchored protein